MLWIILKVRYIKNVLLSNIIVICQLKKFKHQHTFHSISIFKHSPFPLSLAKSMGVWNSLSDPPLGVTYTYPSLKEKMKLIGMINRGKITQNYMLNLNIGRIKKWLKLDYFNIHNKIPVIRVNAKKAHTVQPKTHHHVSVSTVLDQNLHHFYVFILGCNVKRCLILSCENGITLLKYTNHKWRIWITYITQL